MTTTSGVLLIPSALSLCLLLCVFSFRLLFWLRDLHSGFLADIQCYACVASFLSCIGGCINIFQFYSDHYPGPWCQVEAWLVSIGDFSVIMWIIVINIFIYYQLIHATTSLISRLPWVHALIWLPALLLTIVAGAMQKLGFSKDDQSWCRVLPTSPVLAILLFSGPLLVSNIVSLVTFFATFSVVVSAQRKMKQKTAPPKSSFRTSEAPLPNASLPPPLAIESGTPKGTSSITPKATSSVRTQSSSTSSFFPDAIQNPSPSSTTRSFSAPSSNPRKNFGELAVRMILQHFVLFIVFLPLAIGFFAQMGGGGFSWTSAQVVNFLWRSQGWLLALLWFSNTRNRRLFWSLPLVAKCWGYSALRK